jgi:hypothetical protein
MLRPGAQPCAMSRFLGSGSKSFTIIDYEGGDGDHKMQLVKHNSAVLNIKLDSAST